MKKPWEKWEEKIGKSFGATKVKGSGNQWANPGDRKSNIFLIEAKQTSKKSFSITHDLWQKISDESLFSHRIPVLAVSLNDLELLVFDKNDALALLNGKNPFSGSTGANLPLAKSE